MSAPQTQPPDDLLMRPVSARFFDAGYLWHYRARCDRVIDGDTFVALVDCGFRAAARPHIRIRGLYAPERGDPAGITATGDLRRVFAGVIPSWEWPLRIISLQRETVIAEVTSFERFVADVFVVDGASNLINVVDLLHA